MCIMDSLKTIRSKDTDWWRNLINRYILVVGKITKDGDGEESTIIMVTYTKMGSLYKDALFIPKVLLIKVGCEKLVEDNLFFWLI